MVFVRSQGYVDLPVQVPCGQCVGCRLERSRQWAIRCVHEAQMHEQNCFITLTYNDEHLPEDRSIDVREFQLFMKRLRFKYGSGIRFFHCGEYGEKTRRPHYHAILFGLDFEDKKLWKVENEFRIYTSEELQELWSDKDGSPLGFCTLGAASFQSAAYVARYVMKKQTGPRSNYHYQWIDWKTFKRHKLRPEYVTMSRGGTTGKGGIGKAWLDKYKSDVFPSDFVVINGKKMRIPKAYDRWIEAEHPAEFKRVKASRKQGVKKHADNNTPARLKVREKVAEERLSRLPRNL